eukprot:263072_1
MNGIKEYEQKLGTCRENAQQMIQNPSFDAVKRKNKIVTTSSDLLKSAQAFTALTLAATSQTLCVTLDSQQIVRDIAKGGSVFDRDLPSTPDLTVKTITTQSIGLSIKTAEAIIGYKIQYAEYNDDLKESDSDEMKIEWSIVEIDDTNDDIDYAIESLNPSTNYVISAALKNQFGYGALSALMKVKTKTEEQWKFNAITEGYEDWIKNNGNTLVFQEKATYLNACCSTGYNSGIHQFKIKVTGDISMAAFCIVDQVNTSTVWIGSHKSAHYYVYSGNGYIYGRQAATDRTIYLKECVKWTTGDIITMVLNCDEGKLSFQIGDKTATVSIGQNKTYYPSISGGKKGP